HGVVDRAELALLHVEPVEVAVENERLVAALGFMELEQALEREAVAVQASRNPERLGLKIGPASRKVVPVRDRTASSRAHSAPPQEEPCRAVQPEQWSRTAIGLPSTSRPIRSASFTLERPFMVNGRSSI